MVISRQPEPWLQRFVDPVEIRRLGAIRHVTCRDLATGERRIVIAAAEISGRDSRVHELLDRVADQHECLDHPNIPRLDTRSRTSGIEYVALRSGGVCDLESLLPVTLANGPRLSPAATVSFILSVTDALRSAHRMHPRPICIGAVSTANFVVAEDGHLDIIGWGYPVADVDRRLLLREAPTPFVAWEASFGLPPSPNGDLDAVGRWFHSLLGAVEWTNELFAAIGHIAGTPRQAELIELIMRLEAVAHARDAEQRSWDEYLEIIHRIAEMSCVTRNDETMRRELAGSVRAWRATDELRIARDGAWFQPPVGRRTEIDRRPSLRGILAALATGRLASPGKPCDADDLLAAGWPGERVSIESGRNRVRVAIATLRTLGLRDVLLSCNDGYLLDPDIAVAIE